MRCQERRATSAKSIQTKRTNLSYSAEVAAGTRVAAPVGNDSAQHAGERCVVRVDSVYSTRRLAVEEDVNRCRNASYIPFKIEGSFYEGVRMRESSGKAVSRAIAPRAAAKAIRKTRVGLVVFSAANVMLEMSAVEYPSDEIKRPKLR